ncbi:translation initiation factor IF-2 [Pisciglobus halotolerans]|uniref:Translation initiation factor IF-2 n=1 Tax=Pisciglobus halotolerans TaxID=745365 RepID=A0A1I3BZ94_9LACT|nr:translation initiation factor IF-2 [Pisciglobus halotolerans]SFH67533.1 translation initiation factor IF-2 [Pisciglobus halotolerans]
MAKKRVYEYAKEKNISSKDVINEAKKMDIHFNTHMSAMEDNQISALNNVFSSNKQAETKKVPEKNTSVSHQNEKQKNKGDHHIDNAKKQSRTNQSHQKGKAVNNEKKSTSTNGKNRQAQNHKQNQPNKQADNNGSRTTKQQTKSTKPAREKRSTDPTVSVGTDKKKAGNKPFRNRGSMGTHGGYNKRKKKGKKNESRPVTPPVPRKQRELPETLVYSEGMTVAEIAKKLHREPAELIKKLFMIGVVATQNQSLSKDAIELLAAEYGIESEEKVEVDISDLDVYFNQEVDESKLVERPAVVTIMGHVDHGKTTLLDTLRNTKVSEGEAGGITQHIGAYQIEKDGKKITFLDTPGHAAFTTMRARGANVTDIAIIVVAADDGVMPQTVEAINHAKAADVPIIVAVNKVDKPSANPDRVMQELTEYGLIPEAWGGDTIFVNISAKFGQNLEELLEMILLVAEVQELKADPDRLALGSVVEARLDKSKGPIATVLIQEGTLRVGDPVVVGTTHGRIRVMVNEKGRRLKTAGPSTPVEITGLNTAPLAGDQLVAFEDEKTARSVGEAREKQAMAEQRTATHRVTLDNLFSSLQEGELKEVNVIIKADVQGSVEALASSLNKIEVEGVRIKIIHTGVGAINESDVTLAAASNAIMIGFNVRPTPQAKVQADQNEVDIRLHRIIYNVIDEIETAMKGMLDPEYEEKVIGQVVVRETFTVSKVGTIAGGFVTDGVIRRNSGVRLIRDNIVIYEGELASLKRFKDDVKEVKNGFECGLMIKDYNDIKVDDVIEAYEMVEIKR